MHFATPNFLVSRERRRKRKRRELSAFSPSLNHDRRRVRAHVRPLPGRPNSAARPAGLLALIAGEAAVEVLARRGLVPLRISLLATAVPASTGRAAVSHRLGAITGGRLRLRATVTGLLARTIRTCRSVNHRTRPGCLPRIPTTVLTKISRGRSRVAWGLRALRAVLVVRVEVLVMMVGVLVLAPL